MNLIITDNQEKGQVFLMTFWWLFSDLLVTLPKQGKCRHVADFSEARRLGRAELCNQAANHIGGVGGRGHSVACRGMMSQRQHSGPAAVRCAGHVCTPLLAERWRVWPSPELR